MDFHYDGQIRRYVTQFMRIFIGFKYQTGDGELRSIPVMYGDLTRQVASIIRDNSENKLPSVPRIACYISGLDLDKTRLSDATFVSKVNVRERGYQMVDGEPVYGNSEGANYTVERLMPTPFKLTVKADIWSSNTDQKLQILEQILVLFNPSLEIQTTDNYLDWTSLSVIELNSTSFTSRSIPQGTESDIDICALDFEMPIWITPPAKVKKLGIVRAVINNMFTDTGDAVDIANLVYNGSADVTGSVQIRRYGIVILKANNGNDYDYEIYPVDVGQAILDAGLDLPPERVGKKLDWAQVLEIYGGYQNGVSQMYLRQPNGNEIVGTIAINPADTTTLILTVDPDTTQTNTILISDFNQSGRGTIDAIINPYSYNPVSAYGSRSNYPDGLRFLMLDDVNISAARGGLMRWGQDPADGSSRDPYDGPDAWKNLDGSDPLILANSIIEWNGSEWKIIFDPGTANANTYVSNLRTGIQYKWDGVQWLKSFEGEYLAGSWRFVLNP
jgi:hypothetical protein